MTCNSQSVCFISTYLGFATPKFAKLCWNKANWFVKRRHMTWNRQSVCFISTVFKRREWSIFYNLLQRFKVKRDVRLVQYILKYTKIFKIFILKNTNCAVTCWSPSLAHDRLPVSKLAPDRLPLSKLAPDGSPEAN